MKTLIITTIIGILLSVTPAPVVEPDGIPFDPNEAASPVMEAFKVRSGETFTFYVDIYDTNEPTVSSNSGLVSIGSPTRDENTWTYTCTYSSTSHGIKYENLSATNQYGTDERSVVFQVYGKPIFTGCRAN